MLRKLYPESQPRQTYRLAVDDLHELAISEYGNPDGIPAVYLHGGPGAGSDPYHAQLFDPEKYRIITFDQRGSGKSTPKHSMLRNDTPRLVDDLDKIRKFLKIDQWVVGGGSWGATLALVYAEQYPEEVLGLILRGVFLGRAQDRDAFLRDDCPAALLRQAEWQAFKADIQALLNKTTRNTPAYPIIDAVYDLLKYPDHAIRTAAAKRFAQWEETISSLKPSQEDIDWSTSDDGLNMGITEVTYMKKKLFLAENQILNDIDKIKHLPVYLFSGEYDLVCPRYQADDLKKQLSNATQYYPIAGHSGSEPENIHCFLTASDALAQQLSLKEKKTKIPAHLRAYLASPQQQPQQPQIQQQQQYK